MRAWPYVTELPCPTSAGPRRGVDRLSVWAGDTAVRPVQLMYPQVPLMQESYVDRILKAKVYDVAVETALEAAPRLSQRLNNHVWFKREDLQPVFSFKIRGAYNKIAQLSAISAQRGV